MPVDSESSRSEKEEITPVGVHLRQARTARVCKRKPKARSKTQATTTAAATEKFTPITRFMSWMRLVTVDSEEEEWAGLRAKG